MTQQLITNLHIVIIKALDRKLCLKKKKLIS